MKSKVYLSALMILLSIILVVVSYKRSKQPNMTKNGFSRKYVPGPKLLKYVRYPDGISYISGVAQNRIYCSATNTSLLISSDIAATGLQVDSLHLPTYLKSHTVIIEAPDIFVFHGRRNTIYHLKLNKSGYDSILVPGPIFTKALHIGGDKFVLRQFVNGIKDQSLVLFNSSDKSLARNDSLNDFYYDSGMLTEGKLSFDKSTGIVVYTYNRANKILILDTNLRLLRTGRSIDTNNRPLLGRKDQDSDALPAYIYNKVSVAFNGKLYLYSKLKADNETSSGFADSCNIDVYDLPTTKYLGSFYLPKLNGVPLSSFKVTSSLLIAAYHDQIAIYNL